MRRHRLKLMFHLVLGYPSLNASIELINQLCERNVDYIEVQVPFSDPMADGPLISMANYMALKEGVGLEEVIDIIATHKDDSTKLFMMSYMQPMFKAGISQVAKQLILARSAGVIIPDLTIDQPEAAEFNLVATQRLEYIPVLSPGISSKRIRLYKGLKPPLVYCTARQGVTGSASSLDDLSYVQVLKDTLQCKVLVGFGIHSPDQLRELPEFIDGVAIGSVIIKSIHDNGGGLAPALRLVDSFITARNQLSSDTITNKDII